MNLVEILENILTKYGQKGYYKSVELSDMKKDIIDTLNNSKKLSKVESAKVITLKNEISNGKTKEAVLTSVSETMFVMSGDLT